MLTRLLSGRRMLIVLDNARDAKHVEHLVTLLPDALVLVDQPPAAGHVGRTTSARRVQVDPMAPAAATALLAMRLGTRREMTRDELTRLARRPDAGIRLSGASEGEVAPTRMRQPGHLCLRSR